MAGSVSGSAIDTSRSLLLRLKEATDKQAWDRFVDIYTPILFGWARRAGLRETDASDLLQEVFVLLLNKLPDFVYDREKGRFRDWLRTLALNRLRDFRRKKQATAIGALGEFERQVENPLESFWDDEFHRQIVARALQIMRRDFEETSWKACWETTFGGRSPAEVASELGISTGAVYIARSRVLRRLKDELAGMCD